MIHKLFNRIIFNLINLHRKKNYTCNVCGSNIYKFDRLSDFFLINLDKHDYIHPIFAAETMNLFQYSCPRCYSSDRDRFYALYLNQYLNSVDKSKEFYFLDIAPAASLSKWINKHKWINHRTADLFMNNVDDKLDITDMNIYVDNKFDFILCSHVLEHIENDIKAMSELHRVLKIGGKAIIMVPILLTLNEDLENPEYKTESDRWKYYGQNDHVRMYSKTGFVQKLTQVGFKVEQLGIDYFGKENFDKYAIHRRSVLYVVTK